MYAGSRNNENDPNRQLNLLLRRNAVRESNLEGVRQAQDAEYWKAKFYEERHRNSIIQNMNAVLTQEVELLRRSKEELEREKKELKGRIIGLEICHQFDLRDLENKHRSRSRSRSHRDTQTRVSYSSPTHVSKSRERASPAPTPGPSSRREVTPPRGMREEPETRREEDDPLALTRLRSSVRDGQQKRGKHGRIDDRSKRCICGLIFPTKVGLDRHVFEKCRGKIFCDICPKWFSKVEDMTRHRNREHEGEPNWVCSGCNRFFWHKEGVKSHKRDNECETRRIRTGDAYDSIRQPDDEDFRRQEPEVDFSQFRDG